MSRGLIALLFLLLLALQWPLWFGEGGWRYVEELREVKRLQQIENERLRARNRALEAEVEDLRSGTEAVEERARRDLGMIREDEVFFFLIGPEPVAPLDRSAGAGELGRGGEASP